MPRNLPTPYGLHSPPDLGHRGGMANPDEWSALVGTREGLWRARKFVHESLELGELETVQAQSLCARIDDEVESLSDYIERLKPSD